MQDCTGLYGKALYDCRLANQLETAEPWTPPTNNPYTPEGWQVVVDNWAEVGIDVGSFPTEYQREYDKKPQPVGGELTSLPIQIPTDTYGDEDTGAPWLGTGAPVADKIACTSCIAEHPYETWLCADA